MGRLFAIDFGRKRTGIAVSDPLQMIATGLTTVATHTLFEFIETYQKENSIESFIIGKPKQMNDEDSENMKYIRPFVKKLSTKYPEIPIIMYDERFTSVLAQRAIIEGGLKKKDRQNKALVDEVSAVIILQSYMESLEYRQNKQN